MPRQPGWRRMQTLFRGRMARCFAPPQGTRQAGRWQTAARWLCRGLRIATGARPPRLTRGACRRIIVDLPRVIAKQPAGAAFGSDGIALRHVLHGASWGRHCFGYAEHGASWRTLPCCSLGQERTCRAGYEVVKVCVCWHFS